MMPPRMRKLRVILDREVLNKLCHSHAFHASHGVAHIAYFCSVMAEGHGLYAVAGGVMVAFSFITVLTDEA